MSQYVFYTHIHIVIHNLPNLDTLKDFKKPYISTFYVRNKRIELLSHPWQGRILPLNQSRIPSQKHVHLPGFEPRTAVPKTDVISISP